MVRSAGAKRYFCQQRACVIALVALLDAATATVQNLRFSDSDTDAGELGGLVQWEADPSPPAGLTAYRVYFATDNAGAGKQQVQTDVAAGAYSSVLDMAANTAKGSFNHIIVYEIVSGAESNPASTYIFDNPTNFVSTMYLSVKGRTAADNAKTALVSGNHAAQADISIKEIMTLKWDGSSVTETAFDNTDWDASTTASFLVTFQTSSTKADIATAMSSYVSNAPLDLFNSGTGSSSTYSLGSIQVTSDYSDQTALPADTDGDVPQPLIASYLARSLIDYNLAYAAMITRDGDLYVLTLAAAQSGVNGIAHVWMGWPTPAGTQLTYVDMSSDSNIDARVTATAGACWQISTDHTHPDCTVPV